MADYIINDNETIFANQINNGWLNTFKANKKLPVIAKRLFATYASAKKFVDTSTDTAIPGLVLSVFNDPDTSKNGIYFVKQAAGVDGATVGILEPAGAGAGSISVNTYADALKEIKVDATTQEVKNLGQVIYVKTATGTAGDENYKAAGAYVVTGAASLEKLGTTSASGDFSTDIANLRTDLGNLSTTVDGIGETVTNIKDVKIPEVEEDIKEVSDAFGTFAEQYNTYKTEALDPAIETVNNHTTELGKVVKTISAGGNTINPVQGVATITYDEALNANSTNAPQTKSVWTAFNTAQNAAVDAYKKSKLSILTPDTISDASVLKRYVFYQGRDAQDPTNTPGTVVGTIDIPKDLVVTSGELVIGDGNNGTILDKQYLKLNIGNGEPVYIAVGDLVDAYVEGDYLSISEGNVLSVDIDAVDAELAKETSAVGIRIHELESDFGTLLKEDYTVEDSLYKIIADVTTDLLSGENLQEHALLELKAVAEAAYTPGGDKIARADLDESTKASLTLADTAIQEVKSTNENQLTIAVENNVATLTPVVAVLADLENGTSPEKLLTAGVAKEYIDNKWDWEVIA